MGIPAVRQASFTLDLQTLLRTKTSALALTMPRESPKCSLQPLSPLHDKSASPQLSCTHLNDHGQKKKRFPFGQPWFPARLTKDVVKHTHTHCTATTPPVFQLQMKAYQASPTSPQMKELLTLQPVKAPTKFASQPAAAEELSWNNQLLIPLPNTPQVPATTTPTRQTAVI